MVIIISYTSMSWVEISCNQKHQDLLIDLKDAHGIPYPRELTLTCFPPWGSLSRTNGSSLQHSRIQIQCVFRDSYKIVMQLMPQLNTIQKFQSLIINIICR